MWYKEHEFGSQIHFHELCKPALNFIFFPWKKGDSNNVSFQVLCCNWVKQKSTLFKGYWGAQNGWEHRKQRISKMEVKDREKHLAVVWGRICWEKEGVGRKNTSKWVRAYLALSVTRLHMCYWFLESRPYGSCPRLERCRMSKSLLDLVIPAAILESSLGSPPRLKRQNIPYT